jgi:hypothetical protein
MLRVREGVYKITADLKGKERVQMINARTKNSHKKRILNIDSLFRCHTYDFTMVVFRRILSLAIKYVFLPNCLL